ncbi:CAP [Strongyloides ratti]|uniref:CAP n=1 Tax=Strongyloides ratti TaxID=34506 RepID=A0A090KR78_STRRB|nr:CAP [Strongyloides ratti]CEF60024.1 CAP [Strongyloides ratti]
MIIKLFSGPLWGFRFQFDEIKNVVTVNEVEPYSEASKKGLCIGDQIISINGKKFNKLIDFCNELNNSYNFLVLEIIKYNIPYNQLLSVQIPKKQIYFKPIIPSNSTLSSTSSDMEILKHLDALKSTLKQNNFFYGEQKSESNDDKINMYLKNVDDINDNYQVEKDNNLLKINGKTDLYINENGNLLNDGKEHKDNNISSKDNIDKNNITIDKDNQPLSNNVDNINNITFGTNNNINPMMKESHSTNFQSNLNMDSNISSIPPPPPPMPTNKTKYSDSKDWKIPFEVSNIGKAEGIVEVPAKQTVSNLKKQITSKLQMKTPTGAVVVEAPKVHTKCLVTECFRNLNDTPSNDICDKDDQRARSLTPMSFMKNYNNTTTPYSLGKYSDSISNLTDEAERECRIKKLHGQLTSPSIRKAKLYNSTYELTTDDNDTKDSPSFLSGIQSLNSNIRKFIRSNDNLSICSYKSTYDNNDNNNNIETLYNETDNQSLINDNSNLNKEKNNYYYMNEDNIKDLNTEREKYLYKKNTINNSSPTSFNMYTNLYDNNNTNIHSSNTYKNEPNIYNNNLLTFDKQSDFGNNFNNELSNNQNCMNKSYDSSRLLQLINQTNSHINKLNNYDLPPNSRSASAVPFASTLNKNFEKNYYTDNMNNQNYSTTRMNNEPKHHTSTWYKNMYKKLHKIEGEEESILKYRQIKEQSPALISQRAYTPSICSNKGDNNISDARYIGLQRSKSATRFQPTHTSVSYDNFNSQNINGQLNDLKPNLSNSRVSLTQNSFIDSKEPLDILQNSNQILSRGVNELKKQQMNEIIQQQKVEKLSEELNQNQNRRHGYTPSATPSLQNNFDRFDCLMKTFNTPSHGKMVIQNDYKTAAAIFNFNGKSNKELSFNKGDVIRIHKIIDDNWSEGEKNGKIGIFPTSYVKMNESATLHNQEKLISIYPFFARNKNELSLKVNEIVTKTRDIDENWIEGINQHGVLGIFPSNYVKQYNECNDIESDFQYINTSKNNDNSQAYSVLPDRPKTPKFMASLISQPQPQFAHMARIDDIDNGAKSTQIQTKKQMNITQKIQEWKDRHENEGWFSFAKMVPRNSTIYRAIYPYKAQINGELDLEVNDIIFAVELLPENYVIGVSLKNEYKMSDQENLNNTQEVLNAKLLELYTTAINSPIGKYVEASYNSAKTYNPLVESTITTLEGGISKAATDYLLPTVAKVYDNYSKSVDGTKVALDKTKEAATVSSAYGLTALVAAVQLGLLAGLTSANFALDTAKVTKEMGSNAVDYVNQCKNTASEAVVTTVEKSVELASIPKNMATEQINYLLDVTTAYAESITNKTIPKDNLDQNSSIFDRLSVIVKFLVSNVLDKKNLEYFEPLIQNLYMILDKIKNNFLLLDVFIKEKKWQITSYKEVSEYLMKTKKVIEEQAEKLNISPEQLLIEQIRQNTEKLDKSTEEIKSKGEHLLTPQINDFLTKIISSIKNFDNNVSTGKSVFDVQDELIQTIINSLSTILNFSRFKGDEEKDEKKDEKINDNCEDKSNESTNNV